VTRELKAVELTDEKWQRHLTSVRRALVLLARLQSGERLERHEGPMVAAATRDLRAVADLIEAVLG
jgi:hypothetical protein